VVAEVLALATQTGDADGVHPLSEDAVLRLRADGDGAVHLWSRSPGGALSGAADGPTGELFVHPAHRRRGLGRALLAAAVDAAGHAAAPGRLRVWAHGDAPAARALADRAGFARVRVLWQMRRPLSALPDVPLPSGVTVRAFRPGADDEAWVAVNGRAFAHHPEQGRWSVGDLRLRMAEPWFDPAGFLLAVDQGDRLLGFHWTKVHPARRRADGSAQEPIGEIYVLGVDPGGHRRGLGASLSVAGLRHLAGLGLTDAMLYVDGSNTAAVALYERLDFTVFSTDVSYQLVA
jgi:mycothiol synthase